MESDKSETVTLDENMINTLQELLQAVSHLPGVFERVEAWLLARYIQDPRGEIEALRKAVS